MKLTGIRIKNYRSVEDSGEVVVEPDVTCLVGKNESGKTAFLQALYRLNPVETNKLYDEVIDFPSRHTRRRKDTEGYIDVCDARFELSDADVALVEAELGTGAVANRAITVNRGYCSTQRRWGITLDQAAIVNHLRSGLDLPTEAGAAVGAANTVAELLTAMEGLTEPSAASTAAVAKITDWRDGDPDLRAIDLLEPRVPVFVYFDEYSSMPGKVSIPHLISRRDAGTTDRGERALLALLDLVGARLEDFSNSERHEHLIRELENAANTISDEVFEYWSQNTDLSVKLHVLGDAEPGAEPPLNQAPLLDIRVYNERHRATVPFDERSRGFVWFFSFLAYFSRLEEEEKTRDLMLLLDEPGTSLHGPHRATCCVSSTSASPPSTRSSTPPTRPS